MPRFADCFVLPVPKKNMAAYKRMAKLGSKVWKQHGALEYCECVGADLKSPCGIPFPKLAKAKPSETVVFSWIVYKSRAHRDAVCKKVMSDKRIAAMMGKKMPFDMNRMSMGGFSIFVDT